MKQGNVTLVQVRIIRTTRDGMLTCSERLPCELLCKSGDSQCTRQKCDYWNRRHLDEQRNFPGHPAVSPGVSHARPWPVTRAGTDDTGWARPARVGVITGTRPAAAGPAMTGRRSEMTGPNRMCRSLVGRSVMGESRVVAALEAVTSTQPGVIGSVLGGIHPASTEAFNYRPVCRKLRPCNFRVGHISGRRIEFGSWPRRPTGWLIELVLGS